MWLPQRAAAAVAPLQDQNTSFPCCSFQVSGLRLLRMAILARLDLSSWLRNHGLCDSHLQGVKRAGDRLAGLEARLAPNKAPGDTKLKLTWLADVSLTLLPKLLFL